ncbi:hypothetical protein [Hyalangium rubrum]|uniref:Barstar (barnase inhibitor) domain-containing protein n=1 Tax=Hyalangium rubrum TaxID=3103134 RepID=A0ABU5H0B6_9BACT|nr:hypothetical protein [Hyalangium sp. s54d21]MDY7226227.1 hypothetical protein [Hyalangium sp. s54d21]
MSTGGETAFPEAWRGRRVGVLDALLYFRGQLKQGRGLWFLTGGTTVDALRSFILGWCANTQFNGGSEPQWQEFVTWLRDVKGEFPGEGWHVKYLRDCDGDHERAALKFLDFVEEFVSRPPSTPPPG